MIKGAPVNQNFHRFLVAIIVIVCTFTALDPFEVLSPSSIPPGDDSRAHVYRISGFAEEYVLNRGLSFRQYNGMLLLNYAPLFYAILYPLSLAFGSVFAYKIGRILVLTLYLVAVYVLARRVGISRRIAMLTIPIAAYFPTLWFVYYKGAYPYLFSWSLTLVSVSILLMYMESRRHEMLILSALIGGLSILAHSYGLINIVLPLSVLVFCSWHKRILRNSIELCLYLLVALSVSSFYVCSVILTIRDSSPLNEVSPCIWLHVSSIDPIGLLMSIISIYVALHIIRIKNDSSNRRILPYGLIIFTLISLISTIFVATGTKYVPLLSKVASLVLPWRFLYVNNATLIALSLASGGFVDSISKNRVSATLFIFTLVTIATVASTIITSTVAPYERPIDEALPKFVDVVRGSRVLVVGTPLTLSNSPVAFSISNNYTTATGSYNQGDPGFFDLTVYYEWVSTLVKNPIVLENIVELTRSRYILTDLDLGVKFNPLVSIDMGKCFQDTSAPQNTSRHEVLCLFGEPLTLSRFGSVAVRLRTGENVAIKVQVIYGGTEEELMILDEVVDCNGNRVVLFQLPYLKSYKNIVAEGLKIYVYSEGISADLPADVINVTVGTVNIIRVDRYVYRGYRLSLYEYYRDPPTAISSKAIIFDTDINIPKYLTILASEGYNSILIADSSGSYSSLTNFTAGIVTDKIERAEKYVKMGYKTVLITYGERFYIKNQTETFAHVETPLLNPNILPHAPGNPIPYLNWDRETKKDDLQRYVDEATQLLHFLKKFMNISVNTLKATIRYTPPEVDTEGIDGQATLVKIAYISIWNSNAKLLRSAVGLVVALPTSTSPEVKLRWSPPLIDMALNYSITTLLISLSCTLTVKILRHIKGYKSARI